jgi:hypothetical protein
MDDEPAVPPIVVFLPGLENSEVNSSLRLAELITLNLTRGPGTYAVEPAPADPAGSPALTDHRRVVRSGSGPVLDLCTADYRTNLRHTSVAGEGIWASIKQVLLGVLYFLSCVKLIWGARRKAKSGLAKTQLWFGFGAAVLLLAWVGVAGYAVAVALDLRPALVTDSERVQDAIALGLTATATWLVLKGRPKLDEATDMIRQVIDYARRQRIVVGATNALRDVLDRILEQDPTRKVHVMGYSFGALVAIDTLFPKDSGRPAPDPRYEDNVVSLITIGCPADFMQLYVTDYLEDRSAAVPAIRWVNVFIPGDVFGSNFVDKDDFVDSRTHEGRAVAGVRPESRRYTDEKLSVWNTFTGRGFALHAGYWDVPELGDCLHHVTDVVLAAQPSVRGG